MAKAPTAALALPKIDREEKTLDLRLRLKGKAAIDLADYQRAYEADHGDTIEIELLAQHIIATFLERDKSFQARRKTAGSA
jgi:hypothetical protein